MRKIVILTIVVGFFASSCLPAPATTTSAPAVDLDATAAVFVQQTLQAMPSSTSVPSNTPVVINETATSSPTETSSAPTETGTPNQTLTTGTATLQAGTTTIVSTQAVNINTFTTTATFTSNAGPTSTQTLHPRFYGTLPPNVPYNSIELLNKSKAEAYISLQVTVADGSMTILEYPVGGLFAVQAPVGKYKYVAWVGGNKITGSFVLSKDNDLRITIFKDRVEIKQR